MSFLTDAEKEAIAIKRMIFHVVGKSVDDLLLLSEISPPQFADFFIKIIRTALAGNLFEFRDPSKAEAMIRAIASDPTLFTTKSQELASEFQNQHYQATSAGVFFVFELEVGGGEIVYALIKYDNEDVVRYIVQQSESPQVPQLQRFHETFVQKREAMQKIALVRLSATTGGRIMVRDRSKPSHISDYFERFLQARRVNSPDDLSEKLVNALKDTFKAHRLELPEDIRRSGVNRIYDVLRQGGHRFDPDDCEPIITSIFGQLEAESAVRKTLTRKLKENGVSEETFDVNPEKITKPTRRRLDTVEGTQIFYDEGNKPETRSLPDGRKEIVIVTAEEPIDDVDTQKRPRSD